MKKTNIVLIGFMGAGKSTVGRKLAGAFDMKFLDADALIEKKYKMKISAIFAEQGEEAFRKAETDLCRQLLKHENGFVLATGGGMPLRKENAELLKQIGKVVFLYTKPDEILRRVKNDTSRPLLSGPDREEKVNALFEERLPKYLEAADYVLETEGKSFYAMIVEIQKNCMK